MPPGLAPEAEIEALRIFDGRGCVKLLDADANLGALVLERLQPGEQLITVKDDAQATSITADLIRQVPRPVPPGTEFPVYAQWAEGLNKLRDRFDGGTGPVPELLVERAETLFAELFASLTKPMLLHGDLHHYNILSAKRQLWLAVDAKGLVCEREYEPTPFLRNNWADQPEPKKVLARRVDQFADELGLDRWRVVAWAFCHTVLSMWWNVEDYDRVSESEVELAEMFSRLLK